MARKPWPFFKLVARKRQHFFKLNVSSLVYMAQLDQSKFLATMLARQRRNQMHPILVK